MPPLPKAPELRQRRNKSATKATLPSEGPERRRLPHLPRRAEGETPWHTMTRAWWHDVWHSPMAGEYVQADVHALYRLAVLIDAFWHQPTQQLASEIRLQQQAFGLTPIDRRRLEWQVAQTEEVTTRRRRNPNAGIGATEPIADPRSVLKVVGEK